MGSTELIDFSIPELIEDIGLRKEQEERNFETAKNMRATIEERLQIAKKQIGNAELWGEIDDLSEKLARKEQPRWQAMGMFNNFHVRHIPGCSTRLAQMAQAGRLDEIVVSDESYSDVYRNQTYRKQAEASFSAIREAGYTIPQLQTVWLVWINKIINSASGLPGYQDWLLTDELFAKMLTPIYVAMRAKGYYRYPDLTA